MEIDITLDGIVQVKKPLDQRIIKAALDEAVFDVAGHLDNKATENIKERIYGRPESPRYRRTGRALGGRRNEPFGDDGRKVENDTRIKGAEENYAPMLNTNKRISSLNTEYWDDAVEDTENVKNDILVRAAKKHMGGTFDFS